MSSIHRRQFWSGFIATGLLAIALNFLPYILTRGAYQTDGLEMMGFPFVFRSLGGFAYMLYFSWSALAADLGFAIIIAVLAGYFWRALCRRRGLAMKT